MGMCLPCLSGAGDDVVVTPDPETRRRQLADAAEKRQKEGCDLFSASMICNSGSCHRRFRLLAPLLLFQSRKLCVYIPSPLSRNPQHNKHSSDHSILHPPVFSVCKCRA
ncbi:small VCP/p97-interacting protein isoform X1 [Megalobrama amblycephala]|uniref:small VCP/p97-interacting protein isoform X1 n=1 Tax=Megalobrama amblycephala TaxID=75352 RepID=UPI0020147C5C|nr:small VCP/p97-interacting protein isoform X1 [Megalobrama amblycephala]